MGRRPSVDRLVSVVQRGLLCRRTAAACSRLHRVRVVLGFIEFIESIIGIVVRLHTLYLCSLPTYVNKS